MTLDLESIRASIPALSRHVHEVPLVYLDNASTTPRPQTVIEAVATYESQFPANVHRGSHTLSDEATNAYEDARRRIAAFLGAEPETLVFTRGGTEAINLVAGSWGATLQAGDEILVSTLEHHANIVPWQLLCQRTGAVLRVVDIRDSGDLRVEDVRAALSDRTRLITMTAVSNAIGTVTPVAEICGDARSRGIVTLIDAAQLVPHRPVEVAALNCDFLTFSGHKMFGPTGIGGLIGRPELLEAMPPWQGGGDMIRRVTFARSDWNLVPWKFEAGTPNVGGVIGLGAAVDWLEGIGWSNIADREQTLMEKLLAELKSIDRVRLIGEPHDRAGVVSLWIDGVDPAAVASAFDRRGLAVRVGHHCASPTLERFGVPATIRFSLAFYNTESECAAAVAAVRAIIDGDC